MKKLMGLCVILSIATSSLMAWGYYPDYYGSYSYRGNWHYPPSYSDGCPQSRDQVYKKPAPPQTMPERRPQYPKEPRHAAKSLEQRYDNLVVMFTKNECGYCRYMKPIMKQVEMKSDKNIKFLYIDIEQNPESPSQYGFSTVPHIVYFKNGKKLDAHGSGDKTMTVEQVKQRVEKFFGNVAE